MMRSQCKFEAAIPVLQITKKRRRSAASIVNLKLSESHRSELNRRPPDYESGALPLSYCGKLEDSHIPSCVADMAPTHQHAWRLDHALERTRTAMPFGTTPSRWRVYQFHHQGKPLSKTKRGRRGSNPRPLE